MAKKRRSLAELKKHLSEEGNSGGSNTGGFWYPLWNLPKDGETSIRILEDPDEDNDLIVYRDYYEHVLDIDGERVRIPCLHTWNEECPICKLSQKLYKAGDKTQGKYFYRSKNMILRALVVKDGLQYAEGEESALGKVRNFKFTFQLSEKLKADIGKLDDEDVFYDLDDGINFSIVKQIVKGDNGKDIPNYVIGSGFSRKNTAIPEKIQKTIEEMPLSDLLPEKPSYDDVYEKLQRHLNEVSVGDDDDDDVQTSDDDLMDLVNRSRSNKTSKANKVEDDDDDVVVEAPAKNSSKGKKKAKAEPEEQEEDLLAALAGDDDDDDDDDADILAQLSRDD